MSYLTFRPSLKPHVVSEREVLLVGETERVALRGRTYVAVVPLLDGTRSPDQVAAALQNEVPPEVTYYALGHLEAQGYVVQVSSERLAPWPLWWLARNEDYVALTDTAAKAGVYIAACGLSQTAVGALAMKVGQSVRLVDDAAAATLEVWVVDDYLRSELLEAVAAALHAGRAVLPVRPAGLHVWLGPLCRRSGPAWPDLVTRLRFNWTPGAARIAPPVTPLISTPNTLDLGLSLAAVVVVRCAAGDVPGEVDGRILTFDTATFTTCMHRLPSRGTTAAPPVDRVTGGATPISVAPAPKRHTADGGHRVCPPHETLDRLSPLVSPITGIIPGIEKLPSCEGVHVYAAVQNLRTTRVTPQGNRILGRPHAASGKGETEVQARVSCLAEAVERWSCSFFEDVPRCSARLAEIGSAAIHPHEVLRFSERQYEKRETLNRRPFQSSTWIPEPFDPDALVEWTPLWSLTFERTRWLPTALCYFGYNASGGHAAPTFACVCSNGCAAGNSIEEAILQGLLELVERDACALWWYNRVRRPGIDLASFQQPFFDAMARHHGQADRALRVLDLRTDLGVPVALAVSWSETDGGAIRLGLGCHLEPRLAVSRALCEINQLGPFELTNRRNPPPERGRAPAGAAQWLTDATIENQPYVVPLQDQAVQAGELADQSTADIASDIIRCVELLRRGGYETLVLDHTRPDIAFPTVRVIVPGLRHFWPRLAPGRLYDVPMSLGWVDAVHREEELNPIPFFL